MENTTAFQIALKDNVATALAELTAGDEAKLIGDHEKEYVKAATDVPTGHKLALRDIASGEKIIKYGVVIGRATADIPQGAGAVSYTRLDVYKRQTRGRTPRAGR